MWSRLTLFDVVLGVYFLFFFTPRWLGYLVAGIILYRIVKDFLPPTDKLVFNLGPLHVGGKGGRPLKKYEREPRRDSTRWN